MALSAGTKLGSYEIIAPIGSGGMGEVYLARDGKLDRQVAVKVLPEAMTRDPERVARFEREAKLLASLNHPNIAAIYGFETVSDTDSSRAAGFSPRGSSSIEDASATASPRKLKHAAQGSGSRAGAEQGIHFLVMELVQGETLAQRLKSGAFAVEDALDVAKQMAEALEAAHERGVIHRDLKPANVMIRPDGTVKVLDFGLARAMTEEPSGPAAANSPTITANYTRPGVVLGTAAYMSPEQARGRPLDKRTDIWSFGVMLFESLTGETLFQGETATDSMGAILHKVPDWSLVPPSTPATVQLLLRRCLTKDRKHRLQDMGDARIELEQAISDPTASSLAMAGAALAPPLPKRRWALGLGLLLTGLFVGVLIMSRWHRVGRLESAGFAGVARFAVPPPPNASIALDAFLPSVALSPDGGTLAYVCEQEGVRRLFVRPIDEFAARVLAHTEGAEGPFFSPNGRWLGFFADLKLKKVSVEGGPATTLCDAASPRGGVWVDEDTIVFTPEQITPLYRVSASGGVPTPITELDTDTGEYSHRWPSLLPDGETIIHAAARGVDWDSEAVWAYSLRTGKHKLIGNLGTHVQYVKSGHLMHVQAGTLMASPFDVERLEATGPPMAFAQGIATQMNTGASQFVVSQNGTLAYLSGPPQGADYLPVFVDMEGNAKPVTTDRRAYRLPRLSPDGSRLLLWLLGSGRFDTWILELDTGNMQRQTFGGTSSLPVWHSNGRDIAFAVRPATGGAWHISIKSADGLGAPTLLPQTENTYPADFSPDGRWLAVTRNDPVTKWDLWVIDLEADDYTARVLLETPANEAGIVFSPDGEWIAYVSDEQGLNEVYVSDFPGGTGKWQISRDGGTQPRWSRDGKKLFYRRAQDMMAVDITVDPSFRVGRPRSLFVGWYEGLVTGAQANFDVLPDDKGFVMIQPATTADEHTQVNVVLNVPRELRRRFEDRK